MTVPVGETTGSILPVVWTPASAVPAGVLVAGTWVALSVAAVVDGPGVPSALAAGDWLAAGVGVRLAGLVTSIGLAAWNDSTSFCPSLWVGLWTLKWMWTTPL